MSELLHQVEKLTCVKLSSLGFTGVLPNENDLREELLLQIPIPRRCLHRVTKRIKKICRPGELSSPS